MSKLIITIDGSKSDEFSIEYGDVTIGRKKDNDIRLDDSTVSSYHAKLVTFFDPKFVGSTYVEDLDSTNGTYVNERRIMKETLTDGDVITIGKYQLVFKFSENVAPNEESESTRMLTSEEVEQLLHNASGESIREIGDTSLIPEGVQWVAQDHEGMWWGFVSKPDESVDGWTAASNEPAHQLLQSSASDDWKNSLRKL